MPQEQIRPSGGNGDDDGGDADFGQVSASNAERDADIDSVLDEIDGVLESNAEEFVKGFVQKGGQ